MARPVLLDASGVLAWAYREPGAEVVDEVLTQAFITAPNMAEVVSKLVRNGVPGQEFATDLVSAGLTVVPLTWTHVRAVAQVQEAAQRLGGKHRLSLGDLCCLAFATVEDAEVLTADRLWGRLELRVRVRTIRP